jgi:hypothetical protein
MYNSDIPRRADLPSTARLIKSTIIALLAAIAILVAIVLPAEYAIDPTGIGRVLKLTQMGEIKQQLAEEAEADRQLDRRFPSAPQRMEPERRSGVWHTIGQIFVSSAEAGELQVAQATIRSDETVITLRPNEGMEYKMPLNRGAQVEYSWKAEGGVVNYDMHGSPGGKAKETSYKSARGAAADQGTLTAGFDGTHGWFWRNRGAKDVTVTLRTKGPYSEIRRVM